MRDRVVIMGISGFSGGGDGEGIPKLMERLRSEIGQPLSIPDRNIFFTKWNPTSNPNPTSAPDIGKLKEAIEIVTPNPSYLAIIGHSFGAWGAIRLSRALPYEPHFIGLIDLVYNVGSDNVFPRGRIVHTWHQDIVPPYGESLSHVPGVTSHHVTMQETWDRESICSVRILGKCVRKKRTSHTDIDSNERVWRDIYDVLKPDIESQ